jgi:hypothetical protein
MGQTFTVEFERRSYVWNGGRWYGAADFVVPREAVRLKLDELLPAELRKPALKAKRPRPA